MSAAFDKITWIEKTVLLEQLTPYERNPRRISEKAYSDLKRSLQEDGYHQRILATPDFRIVGGHQRIKALTELGFTEIKILVPDHDIDEEQFKRLLIRDNLPFGEFDFDMLATDFGPEELISFGMSEKVVFGMTDEKDEKKAKKDVASDDGFHVLVTLQTEPEQEALFNEMKERGHQCKLLT